MVFVREGASANFVAVLGHGAGDLRFQVGIRFDESRHVTAGDAEEVVQHQHLAVAVGAGADADRGDRDLLGDFLGQLAGDAFEHHREGAGVLRRLWRRP